MKVYFAHKYRVSMFKEFKEFISKGNVIDLAVGIIMGAAFTGVVNSLVSDVIMPPIGKITGGMDFSDLFIALDGQSYTSLKSAKEAEAATLNYGAFVNTLINFLIVSAAVFFLVKNVNRFRAQPPQEPAAPPHSEKLLEEIRDLLKSK